MDMSFQSALPRGERHLANKQVSIIYAEFQSALPRGERPLYLRYHPERMHFNPRSREGSDVANVNFCMNFKISIHAPARGATSIPCMGKCVCPDFNPRSREGSDAASVIDGHDGESDFNPRSREGSDSWRDSGMTAIKKFQSTLPRGERLYNCCRIRPIIIISIHAPARGATMYAVVFIIRGVFQSTLPRGERHYKGILSKCEKWISIHAPARGATFFPMLVIRVHLISIHAPARGATPSERSGSRE